ncbi:MAG: hypothetical protein M3139_10680 [Bacteroidota bacterium]|nr:hypothetical protein [Bacteroidota bacterium]
MKHTLLLPIVISFILISFSCQKSFDTVPPQTIDSVKSILPKQINWSVSGYSVVLSIKYDTANRRIELYEDDTTNSNPYDRLAISYAFNNDGYLVNYTTNITSNFTLGVYFEHGTVNINRDANNKINYIAFGNLDNNKKDTSFYTYQAVSGGVKILTAGTNGYHDYNTTYHYDNNNNLLDYHGDFSNDYSATHSYNANNSLNKILVKSPSNNQTDFLYSSGIPDEKEDLLFNLLIGKDNYLWDLKELYPFLIYLNPDYDDYDFSVTNPYHLTSMKDTHQPDGTGSGIEQASLTYAVNQNKLLSKVTLYIDRQIEGTVLFKY